jgi:nucleotide-binding universal stress UspA family protein
MKVIAALDNSLAAQPVLATALAFAKMLGADVEAVHVPTDHARVARSVARAAGLELRLLPGPVVERLSEVAEDEQVAGLVLGARGTPAGRRPLGGTALALATSISKPVVVVPPDARPRDELRRVLVPVEGTRSAALTPRAIIRLAAQEELDVVVLHVREEDALPAFTDQPQHEQRAWDAEFLRRYCPWGIGRVRLELRLGRAEDVVPLVAAEEDVDVIALAWAQELAEGRAAVVRSALMRGGRPVLLVPVDVGAESVRPIGSREFSGRGRREPVRP